MNNFEELSGGELGLTIDSYGLDSNELINQAKEIVSEMFDVSISEIQLADDGFYTAHGTNKSADLQEISAKAIKLDMKLEAKSKWSPRPS